MKTTKSYGVVSGWQEHKMLVQAEHTYERKRKGNNEVISNHSHGHVHRGKTGRNH